MNKQPRWLELFLPSPSKSDKDEPISGRKYLNFSRWLSGLLLIIVIVPLTIMSGLSYYQYKQLLKTQELEHLALNLEEAQSTIEAFVSELQSVVKFIANDDSYQDLLNKKKLESLFTHLKKEYPDFADIEVINAEGVQESYYGPYSLKKHNYSNQNWYKEVLSKGVYISGVFSGYRNVPHFVIAVSKRHSLQENPWVLRVTIESATLQNFINTISTSYTDDMYLVESKNDTLQTIPKKYGEIGEKCFLHGVDTISRDTFHKDNNHLIDRPLRCNETEITTKDYRGQNLLHASIDIHDTPWHLVMIKKQYLHANPWMLFKTKLTIMFAICVIIAIFLILEISTVITKYLHDSDKKRQQLYREAENRDKLASIGRLAAGVAHEINNPLSIINQKTGLAQDFMEFSDNFTHKKALEEALISIQKSVERCKAITHRLLGFARQTDVQTEKIDVNETIREVVEFLAKEATYNQIKIVFNLNKDLKNIWSDRGPLQQILLNIVNNAIDTIESGGKITFTTKQINTDTIKITIVDDGPGMSDEVIAHIFEPFFTTKETGKGTGLGLSITYGLVQKLGGTIKVKSRLGVGTIFRITLPIIHDK